MDYLDKAYTEFAQNGAIGITKFVGKNVSLENLIHELLFLHIDKINHLINNNKNINSVT